MFAQFCSLINYILLKYAVWADKNCENFGKPLAYYLISQLLEIFIDPNFRVSKNFYICWPFKNLTKNFTLKIPSHHVAIHMAYNHVIHLNYTVTYTVMWWRIMTVNWTEIYFRRTKAINVWSDLVSFTLVWKVHKKLFIFNSILPDNPI